MLCVCLIQSVTPLHYHRRPMGPGSGDSDDAGEPSFNVSFRTVTDKVSDKTVSTHNF